NLPRYSTFICASRRTRATAIAPFSCWSIPMMASATNSRDMLVSRLALGQRVIENIGSHTKGPPHCRYDFSDRRSSVEGFDDRGNEVFGSSHRGGHSIEPIAQPRSISPALEMFDFFRMAAPRFNLGG